MWGVAVAFTWGWCLQSPEEIIYMLEPDFCSISKLHANKGNRGLQDQAVFCGQYPVLFLEGLVFLVVQDYQRFGEG